MNNNNHHSDPLNQAKEIWATILRKGWSILLASVILVAFAIVVISLLPDYYSANTTVLFDPQRLPDKYVAPTVTADPAQRLTTLTQEVLSAERLRQISQQLHLYVDSGKSPAGVVDQMRKDITIDMKPNPGHDMTAFGISYVYGDPQIAAEVANRLAQSFIDWDLANRVQQAASTAAFMNDQLQEAKQLVDQEEAKVKGYKVRYAGELPEQLPANMQALAMLHSSLQANREALDRLEQEKATLNVAVESDHLQTERRSLEAELATLRAQYTEQFPDVITTRERLERLNEQLSHADPGKSSPQVSSVARLQMIERQTARLQVERQHILQGIDKYQASLDATPLREQEFSDLNRNYSNAREQYESLLDKKFQADMAMELERKQKASRFTVDQAQVPTRPTKPNRLLLFSLAIPLVGLIPAGIVVAHTEIRGTVNSERALRSLLPDSTRILGRIPVIETPSIVRKQRRLAMLSILGSIACCAAVAAFLWGGTAAQMRKNRAHQFNPANTRPRAELLLR